MSQAVASHDESRTVSVWDPFVRIFHWSLAASVFLAFFFTDDGDKPHQVAGYVAMGLVVARILWGFIGTRYARFSQFVPGLGAVTGYLGDVLKGREARYLGHNPAGGIMVVILLLMVLGAGVTGWMMTTDAYFGEEWVEELHEVVSNVLMVCVGVHVGGVIFTGWRHRENLVRAMLTGRKAPLE